MSIGVDKSYGRTWDSVRFKFPRQLVIKKHITE